LFKAFKDDKEMCERILPNIRPDCANYTSINNAEERKRVKLEFLLLKLIYKISKLGKDAKYVYEVIDTDKSGKCKMI
jgi:hypothetical protein